MSRIYLLFGLLTGFTLMISMTNNPPDAYTNAPGEGLCTECHTLNGGTQNGTLALTGFPSTIIPNMTYLLTITNSNPNGVANRAGFQMTVLNSNNQKAGNFVPGSNDPASTITNSFNQRQYWEHNPSQLYPANNMVSWTVSWTAPAGPPGAITYYAAGNVANNNNATTGDLIITTTGTGTLMMAGDPVEVEIVDFTHVLCFGGNTGTAIAQASGGALPYSYTWSNGATGASVGNLTAGLHTVTVTDAAGSTATASVTITQPPVLILQNPVIGHVSCFGGSNGSIQVNASGGVPGYAYVWSNGQSGTTINGLAAGSYTVTVTDQNQCTTSMTYTVNQPQDLVINLANLEHESCFGESDGTISIAAAGGTTPYFAEWSNGFIGMTISGLEPDIYTVTVTDLNNCSETATYMINQGNLIDATLQNIQHVSCNGGNDGALTVQGTGGSTPYAYNWSNGSSGPSISNLAAGNYLVTVTDGNGCQTVKLYMIQQPPAMIISIASNGQNLCSDDELVDLTASVSNAQPPFTSVWSNGVQGLTNSGLAAGTYSITVTDGGGCTASSSFTVTAPPQLLVTVSATHETAVGAEDGTATATPAGGTSPYAYQWSNEGNTGTISDLPPGSYAVTVTDSNGCTATGSVQVNPFGCELAVEFPVDTIVVCDSTEILLEPQVTGPSGTVVYQWSNGVSLPFTVVLPGDYCVTVTDESGCQASVCIVIAVNPAPLFDCPVTHESSPGAADGAVGCDHLPGIISFLWSTGDTTSFITGLAPGEYCLEVTDTAFCSYAHCFIVQPGDCQLLVTSITSGVSCNGGSDGSISVQVDNAAPPVSYLWSTGDTTSVLQGLPAGNYSVTLTDAAGCLEVRTFGIGEPPPLVVTIDQITPIGTLTTGAIEISVAGGTAPFSYHWTFPDGTIASTQDLFLLTAPGLYALELTDANECTVTMTVEVELDVAVGQGPEFRTLKIYPVPARDILILDLPRPVDEVWITGVDGRVVQHIRRPAANRLDVGSLQPGWYLLRITDGSSWYVARMVK